MPNREDWMCGRHRTVTDSSLLRYCEGVRIVQLRPRPVGSRYAAPGRPLHRTTGAFAPRFPRATTGAGGGSISGGKLRMRKPVRYRSRAPARTFAHSFRPEESGADQAWLRSAASIGSEHV